jgi:hypothetical protein
MKKTNEDEEYEKNMKYQKNLIVYKKTTRIQFKHSKIIIITNKIKIFS